MAASFLPTARDAATLLASFFISGCFERTFVRTPFPTGGETMKRHWAFLTLALVFLLFHCPAQAQSSTAEAQLNGSIRDQTGSVIVKAAVALRNVDTNQIYKTS